jgi:hypothetical protein
MGHRDVCLHHDALAVAESIAGWFTEYLSWKVIFWQNIVVAPIAIFPIMIGLPVEPMRLQVFRDTDYPAMIFCILGVAALTAALARISHRIRCIGARILRESCCDHGFSQIHRTPQCKQTVTPHCLNFHPSEAAMLWPRLTVVRSPPMPARCCWARPTERSG